MASNKKELEELDAQEARRQRKEKEKTAKKRVILVLALIIVVLALLIVLVLGLLLRAHMRADVYTAAADTSETLTVEYVGEKTETAEREVIIEPEVEPEKPVPSVSAAEMESSNLYMIRPEDEKVVLDVNGDVQMYPASMTKMMTAILAIENLDMEQMHTVMYDEVSYAWEQDATMAGFNEGEVVPVLDLVYGALLPSGAECYRSSTIAASTSRRRDGIISHDVYYVSDLE